MKKKYLAILTVMLSAAFFTGCQMDKGNSVNNIGGGGTQAEEAGTESVPEQDSQEILESASLAEPDSPQEPKEPLASTASSNNQDVDELQQVEKMLFDFGGAYLTADTDSIKQYLTDPYEWDIELYQNPSSEAAVSGIQCLEDIQGKSIGDIAVVYLQYKESSASETSQSMTVELIKSEDGWKIQFYGFEG